MQNRLAEIACRPLTGTLSADALHQCWSRLAPSGRDALLSVLQQYHLAPLWTGLLEQLPAPIDRELVALCREASLSAGGRYLQQRHMATRARDVLAQLGITHVLIKGAHTRELLFAEPFRRPAADVDLLVRPSEASAAITALVAAGFAHHPRKETLTHETSLTLGAACLDLHWELMRPARMRSSLVEPMLADARHHDWHWGPQDVPHLALLLTHPVFAKYLTTAQAGLIRFVELGLWLQMRPPDWDRLIEQLQRLGLRTAAWMTLTRLNLITSVGVPETVERALAPGGLRQTYLRAWIERDIAGRLRDYPWLVQLGMTLPAHDSPGDALRMLQRHRHGPIDASRISTIGTSGGG